MTTPASATRPDTPHALVTGAAGGIGAAIARQLAADGCSLTLVGRTAHTLHALAESIDGDCRVVVCDVAESAAVQQAFTALPPVHILINNAGAAESAPVARTSDDLWHRLLAVNLSGTFFCTRAVLEGMRQSGWGRIVNIASTAGQRGYGYVAAYAAAKHGVVGFTRSLALEVATSGITVNAVCPGFTDTEMLARSVANIVEKTGRSDAEARAQLAELNPQRRFVTPQDVAARVAWLCSDGAAAMTGQAISVSGGEVM